MVHETGRNNVPPRGSFPTPASQMTSLQDSGSLRQGLCTRTPIPLMIIKFFGKFQRQWSIFRTSFPEHRCLVEIRGETLLKGLKCFTEASAATFSFT